MKRTIYEDMKAYYNFQDRVVPYIVVAIVVIAVPMSIYSYFNLFTLHTKKVQVFCKGEVERIGVNNTRQIHKLKLYFNQPNEYENLGKHQKIDFEKSLVELSACQEGYMFPEDSKGAKKVRFIDSITKRTSTVYILEKFINSEN